MKWQAQGVRESERFGRLAQADPLLDRPSFAHACGIEVVGTTNNIRMVWGGFLECASPDSVWAKDGFDGKQLTVTTYI